MRARVRPPRLLKLLHAHFPHITQRPNLLSRNTMVAEQDIGLPKRLRDLLVQFAHTFVCGEVGLEGGGADGDVGGGEGGEGGDEGGGGLGGGWGEVVDCYGAACSGEGAGCCETYTPTIREQK